jgi:hypothetical protein
MDADNHVGTQSRSPAEPCSRAGTNHRSHAAIRRDGILAYIAVRRDDARDATRIPARGVGRG